MLAAPTVGKYYDDQSLSIGNSPMVKINRIVENSDSLVLAKIEGRNPAYSVKCRIGANMIWDAEKNGILSPGGGKEIIEPTSGNTGIALAYVGASRGYQVNLTMPETMSMERRKVLITLGANLILTDGAKGMPGAIARAQEIHDAEPDKYFMPQQFKNPANPEIHEKTTGPEIWEQTEGKIDIFVSGVGTGGTITGVSRYIKNTMGRQITSIAVEPENSPVMTQTRAGEPIKPGPHKIQGIGAGFIPDTLDMDMVDEIETVTNEESIECGRRLAKEEGIMAGISCGAAMAVAARVAARPENKGKCIVVILPDASERYLTSILFDGLFKNI